MRIHINHTTRYSYNESVKHSIQCLRLTPQTLAHQRVLSWRMTLPRLSSEVYDGFGNYCTILNLAGPLQSLEIQAQGTVEIGGSAEHILDKRIHPLVFLNSTALTGCNEAMRDFAEIQTGGEPDRQGLMRLSRAVLDHMTYIPGTTHVATAAAEAFALGSGVCQDHTHVFLACARALDVPLGLPFPIRCSCLSAWRCLLSSVSPMTAASATATGSSSAATSRACPAAWKASCN